MCGGIPPENHRRRHHPPPMGSLPAPGMAAHPNACGCCQQNDQAGDFTLVSCQGALVASYGAEDLVLDFSERVYKVIQEGGDWRMCGYK